MLKVDLTITLNGNDILVSYEDGKKLFTELSGLYSPHTASIDSFDDPFDAVSTTGCSVSVPADAENCDYKTYNGNVNVEDPTKDLQDCGTAGIAPTSCAKDVDNFHLGGSDLDDESSIYDDPNFQKPEESTLEALNVEIEERLSKMKELVAETNKDEE